LRDGYLSLPLACSQRQQLCFGSLHLLNPRLPTWKSAESTGHRYVAD
jgi:hypothetical protein